MITIDGKYTEARVFTDELEDLARTQIRDVCNHPAFEGSRVRIMPDVHAGAGCVIGFTAELKTDKVIPNLIGVDIGCGVLTARLSGLPDFSSFDARLRERVPSGMHARPSVHQALLDDPELDEEISRICMDVLRTDKDRHRRSVGSLGGGNHFIEIAQGKEHAFLCIHSGSRNFGLKIAERYQKIAVDTCPDAYLKERKKGLCYLQGENTLNYMRDMKVAQRFAALNRRVILHELLDDAADLESFDTVHNYIAEDQIIRKGAVRAGRGEKLIVPLNMRDGSVICIGKGNEEFNSSSPHGAGRSMSRKRLKPIFPWRNSRLPCRVFSPPAFPALRWMKRQWPTRMARACWTTSMKRRKSWNASGPYITSRHPNSRRPNTRPSRNMIFREAFPKPPKHGQERPAA